MEKKLFLVLLTLLCITMCACSNSQALPPEQTTVTLLSESSVQTSEVAVTETEVIANNFVIEIEEYCLIDQPITTDNTVVHYPIISELTATTRIIEANPDIAKLYEEYQIPFNVLLKDYAINYWNEVDSDKSYEVTFEVTHASWGAISILYSLKEADGEVLQKHSLTLDFGKGSQSYWFRGDEEATEFYIQNLWEVTEKFDILTEGISAKDLSEYLQVEYGDIDTFREHFQNAGNVEYETEHDLMWLYFSEEGDSIFLLIPVSSDMGNYVEIELPIGG
jgi:hypothetical protein